MRVIKTADSPAIRIAWVWFLRLSVEFLPSLLSLFLSLGGQEPDLANLVFVFNSAGVSGTIAWG